MVLYFCIWLSSFPGTIYLFKHRVNMYIRPSGHVRVGVHGRDNVAAG